MSLQRLMFKKYICIRYFYFFAEKAVLELSLGFYQGFVVLCNSTKEPASGFHVWVRPICGR